MKNFLIISIFLFGCASTNGPKLLKVKTPIMPLTRVTLYFPFGAGDEKPGEEGSTLLISKWMDSGSQKYPSMNKLNQANLGLGATITTQVHPRYTTVSVESPSDTFIEAWNLALEKVRHPYFAENELATARSTSFSLKKTVLNTWNLAGRQFAAAVAYAGSKEAHADVGTETALRSLTSDRLKIIYQETFGKGPAAILATQSIAPAAEKEILQSIAGWKSDFTLTKPKPIQPQGRNLIIVDRPDSTQAYLFFIKAGPFPGTEEQALAAIGTQILGSNGGNSSILFDELRAKRGLTYHASIQLTKSPKLQMLIGVTFGSNEKLEELAHLYLTEWEKFYANNSTSLFDLQQSDFAYRSMRARESETIADIMKTAAETFSVTGDVKPIWVTPQITQKKYEAAKTKWLSPEDFTLLAFGDKTKVKEILEKAIAPTRNTIILSESSDWDAVSQAVSELK
jgi:zinc protease